MKTTADTKKILTIAGNVLMYLFIALSIIAVILTISVKKGDDGAKTVFGMQLRYVISPSMEKSEFTNTDNFKIKDIPLNSMVFVKVMPKDKAEAYEWYKSLEVGDVLTFRYVYTTQETITHRIVAIEEKEDKSFLISLEGDNKSSEIGALTQTIDTSIENSPNYVIGKVVGQSKLMGLVVTFLRSPVALVCCVIIPCFAIAVWEILKVMNILGADKRKQEQEEKERQKSELEELKRRLAELESKKSEPTDQNG